jgi:Glycosyl transferases group 1
MRVFQNSGVYPAYLPRLRELTRYCTTFSEQVNAFLHDRYGAAHFLAPILEKEETTFFTNADDDQLQRQWAKEQGLPAKMTNEAILLAQIENHRTEIFYNMDPMRYGSDFVRKLPSCVRKSIAWRAAPSPGANFEAYDLMVCNFPRILESYRRLGWRAAYFAPAHDPEMDAYAANFVRPVDILFVGGYSRHHRRRAHVLEVVAALNKNYKIAFHLDRSRLTRFAESPLGQILPIGDHRRPQDIRAVSAAPVFGRDLYAAISRAKIVLNGAVDMAGDDRGNMRCFEAMGCGALMVSDKGNYPLGMVDSQSMLTYADSHDVVEVISRALSDPLRLAELAAAGVTSMHANYAKHKQWIAFQKLLEFA